MTGMERLKEEMINRGCTKSQVESKAVAVVVDILAQTGTHYLQEYQDSREIADLKAEAGRELSKARTIRRQAEFELQQAKREKDDIERHRKSLEEYIQVFTESLKQCESAEGRDRMKAAQMFCESVTIRTAYDNTEFIKGLAAILAGQTVAALSAGIKQISQIKETPKAGQKL